MPVPFLTCPLQGDFNALPIKVERMRRVCSVDFLAHSDLQSEHLIGDPFLEGLHRFLNLRTTSNEERDTIADGETQFLPQPLNAAHHLTRESFEPELTRYNRIEGGKIATFLLHHHVARSGPHDRQILGTELPRFVADRYVQRLSGLELGKRLAAQSLYGFGGVGSILAEFLTQRPEIRPSL